MKIRSELERQLSMGNEHTNKAQRLEYKKSLAARLDVGCYLVLILLYLADENILVLLFRGFQQFMLGHPPSSMEVGGMLTLSIQRVLAQKVLLLGIGFNMVAIAVHVVFSARDGLGDSVSYGAYILNIIGELQFRSWPRKLAYLLMWDAVLCLMQFALYSLNFVKEGQCDADDDETVASIDVVKIVKHVKLFERTETPAPSLSEMMPGIGV
ncbi:hypothetical protein OGAPHI_004728 [Ogataea philodendri]|uniref:DUF1746 domain-containing protein n=1 Tax=Ogataea philodendri TaxID=1378263 RepID=A0A9P8P2S7_9ASCO|nr:uncharacterized protein OGAPHI_004728 [Ogataea philodendri]KAH3664014.1 hypothetical protein OGAPHI_004728 [Ogataea philodendri]